MNGRDVARLADIIRVGWPNRQVAHDDLALQNDVWTAALTDFDLAEAEAVITTMLRSGRPHPPGVSEVAGAIHDLREKINGTAAPDSDEMLAEVTRAVQRRGYQAGPPKQWSHPAVAAAVRAIGWRDLCLSDKPSVLRAQLLRAYETAAARVRSERVASPQQQALVARRQAALPNGHTPAVRSLPLPDPKEMT